ncbi:MAG: cytochrome P450 [Anaerolineales bacterium]|nr:cytochrome P450 [Anaerolineales bacterium]
MLKTPPKLQSYPFVGQLPGVWKDPLRFFVEAATHGRVVQLDLGPSRFYLIHHPDDVKYVLQDNQKNFVKAYDPIKPLFGDGLLTSNGEKWLRHRRLMQPAFHRTQIAQMAGVMTAATETMLARWAAQPTGKPLEISSEMMLLTQTIIVRTMFSTDVSANAERIGAAFDYLLAYFNRFLFSPIHIPLDWPTPANRRFKRERDFITQTVYAILADRRRSGRQEADLLSMLLAAREEGDGRGLSDEEIRDEIITIFLAGHETTATLLSWTWYVLSRQPQILSRLEDELARVLSGRTPTFDDLPRLTYTRLVLDETLRLYPPAWMFVRTAVADDELGGYHVPAGASIFLSPYVTHRLPEFWPEPETFDPERFRPEAVEARHKLAYFPFAAGPRKCIGDQFALVEATLLLATIAQRYRLKAVPGYRVRPTPLATLRPRPGLLMTLEKR